MKEGIGPVALDNFDITNDEWDYKTKHLSPKIRKALNEVKIQFDQKLIQKHGAVFASDYVKDTMPQLNHKEWTEKLLFKIKQANHEKSLIRSFSDYIRVKFSLKH